MEEFCLFEQRERSYIQELVISSQPQQKLMLRDHALLDEKLRQCIALREALRAQVTIDPR
jgi:hypothetical protein